MSDRMCPESLIGCSGIRIQRDSHATSVVFKWGVCRLLTEVALDDLDPGQPVANRNRGGPPDRWGWLRGFAWADEEPEPEEQEKRRGARNN